MSQSPKGRSLPLIQRQWQEDSRYTSSPNLTGKSRVLQDNRPSSPANPVVEAKEEAQETSDEQNFGYLGSIPVPKAVEVDSFDTSIGVGATTQKPPTQPVAMQIDSKDADEQSNARASGSWHPSPQYYCPICQLYVGETESDRQYHKTTPRHQENFGRSLREFGGKKQTKADRYQVEPLSSMNVAGTAQLSEWGFSDHSRSGRTPAQSRPNDRTVLSANEVGKVSEHGMEHDHTGDEDAKAELNGNDKHMNNSLPRQISSRIEDEVASIMGTRRLLGMDDPGLRAKGVDGGETDWNSLYEASSSSTSFPHESVTTFDPTGVQRLEKLLKMIHTSHLLQVFLDHGVNDLWFPFSKQTLRYLLRNAGDEKRFLQAQEDLLDIEWSVTRERSPAHSIFEDGEDVLGHEKILGEGGFAIVEQIKLPDGIACVRKRIGRVKQFKAQKQLMTAFASEIKIMRQVSHRHCVEFIGSYTDHDNVAIILSPVADMDLATLLDSEHLDGLQERILRQGIGCLCNALLYLHDKKIRHEDMKPQNVLVHGENILLTDFGFSLDFSDDSVSTTTGRPMHWTARYSAPETMDHEPRNRATDIWGLGCILLEMVSHLYGHRLSIMRQFWKQNGNGHPSFAMNEESLKLWIKKLLPQLSPIDHFLDSLISMMMRINRLERPTCQQVVDKLAETETIFHQKPHLVGHCCAYEPQEQRNSLLIGHRSPGDIIERPLTLPPGYFESGTFDNYTSIFADVNFKIITFDINFPLPKPEATPFSEQGDIRDLFADREGVTTYFMHLMNKVEADITQISEKDLALRDEAPLHTLMSSLICPVKDMVSVSFREPFKNQISGVSTYPVSRLVKLSFMPICLARSPLHGAWFFKLSFMIDEDQVQLYELSYKEWREEKAESAKFKLFARNGGRVVKYAAADRPRQRPWLDEDSDTGDEAIVRRGL